MGLFVFQVRLSIGLTDQVVLYLEYERKLLTSGGGDDNHRAKRSRSWYVRAMLEVVRVL
jgi:hypothetical protein